MTALLEEAIEETKSPLSSEQDFVAALLLENIRDTRQWDAQFAGSKDVLEGLFDEATQEYQAGSRQRLTNKNAFPHHLLIPQTAAPVAKRSAPGRVESVPPVEQVTHSR